MGPPEIVLEIIAIHTGPGVIIKLTMNLYKKICEMVIVIKLKN